MRVWAQKSDTRRRPVGPTASPPAFVSETVRVETETDHIERTQVERLAHVKELIEIRLGQSEPAFGQRHVSVRHFRDHLVVTWEGGGEYGAAWNAWTRLPIRVKRARMAAAKRRAAEHDEEYRNVCSELRDAPNLLACLALRRARYLARAARDQAWSEYYNLKDEFESAYEEEVVPIELPDGVKLTFENTVVFNVNGTVPEELPSAVHSLVESAIRQLPVNHFVRVQRNNFPDALGMSSPAFVENLQFVKGRQIAKGSTSRAPETYATDESVAQAIIDEIFIPALRPKVRHLKLLADFFGWVVLTLAVAAIGAAVLAGWEMVRYDKLKKQIEACQSQIRALESVDEAVSRRLTEIEHRLSVTSGRPGAQTETLSETLDALDDEVLKLESEINGLRAEIRALRAQQGSGQSDAATRNTASGGLDAVPCWEVAPEAGLTNRRVPYLFTIELREDDVAPIRVSKRFDPFVHESIVSPSPFAGEEVGANYSRTLYSPAAETAVPLGQWISSETLQSQFLPQVSRLYSALGSAHACRHYVRLCDGTYNHKEAAAYKRLRSTIEGSFYIYRPPSGACPSMTN